MRSRLHRLTVCCLVAIYGLVGLTGESLQYLADDLGNWLATPSVPLASTGYYHSHGPGGHRHFHRHPVKSKQEVAKDSATSSHPGGSYRFHRAGHLDHDCPLLSVLATLKLGHIALAAVYFDSAERHQTVVEPNSSRDFHAPFRKLARGPPHFFVA